MKSISPLLIVGLIVSAVSAFVLFRGGSLTTQRDVLAIGDVKVTAESQQPIKPWMAGIGLAIGVTILLVHATRKP